MEEMIFENKENILDKIDICFKKDSLNFILVGDIPPMFIKNIIHRYYGDNNNIDNYVIYIDCYNDINILSENNNIVIHSKKKSLFKKIIILYNFDNVSEHLQSNFKLFMNENTHFIFCVNDINYVYESIITRTTHIIFEPNTYKNNMLYILSNYKSIYNNNLSEKLIKGLSFREIDNISEYVKLLGDKCITDNHIKDILLFQEDNIREFINKIYKNDLSSINVLYKYYNNGYSLLDIFYFIYEYVNINIHDELKFIFISVISKYINNIYEGYDSKIIITFFTIDILNKYNDINIYETNRR